MRKVAIPGSFDPLTNGHTDIIQRASTLFDEVVVVVAQNTTKACWFSLEERCTFVKESIQSFANVSVDVCQGLLITYCQSNNIKALLRGIRTFSDYEYESSMSRLNQELYPELETLFMMSDKLVAHINSNMVKEFARFEGELSGWVPKHVEIAIINRIKQETS